MADVSVLTAAPQAAPAAAAPPPDPYLFRIRDLIYQTAGILFTENKFYYLSDRCLRRMEAVGAPSLGSYFDLLTTRCTAENEMRLLLNEITIGETCFFRNQPQLDALRATVLPAVAEQKAQFGYKRLSLWSAGCSTGEEPYTLAMILLEESLGMLRGWSLEVHATDINERSLTRAREGVYSEYALRNIPPAFLQKYMRPVADGYQVNEEVKSLVKFNRVNLRDDSRMVFMKGLDVIFCCNVLIYFGAQPKRRVIQHFFNDLLPGGYLFLGHSESLFGLNDDFKLVHFPQATAYRKPPRQAL
jgi:chemotaxis protein methyltransferase CheR